MLELAVCPWVFSHFFCLATLYVLLCVERYAWCILQDRVLQDRGQSGIPIRKGASFHSRSNVISLCDAHHANPSTLF